MKMESIGSPFSLSHHALISYVSWMDAFVLLVCVVVGIVSSYDNKWPKSETPRHVVYGKPLSRQLFFGLLAFIFVSPLFTTWGSTSFWLFATYNVLLLPMCIFFCGPGDIRIDLKERSYQTCIGWPLFPRIDKGSLEDFLGVYVLSATPTIYLVKLAWKDTQRRSITIGQFASEERACKMAEKASVTINLLLLKTYTTSKQSRGR